MKKMYGIILSMLMLTLLTLTNCSKDDININLQSTNINNPDGTGGDNSGGNNNNNGGDNNGGDNNGGGDSGTSKLKVYFRAGVVHSPQYTDFTATTSSTTSSSTYSNIGVGRYVNISAFNNDNITVQAKGYTSSTAGTLSPTDNTQISLSSGTYDIYAAGVNVPAGTAVPTFTFGSTGSATCSSLENGIDYIWASNPNFTPSTTNSESNNIYLKMTHCCAQIIVNLTAATGITINDTPTFNITPSSTSGISWNLSTGVITASKALGGATAMSVGAGTSTDATTSNAYNGQLTMLPLASISTGMTCTFSVTINGESTARNYQLTIPPYDGSAGGGDGGYAAGYSYTYNLELDLNEVTFNATNSVQVKNWQVVSISGVIIPSQES